MDAISWPREGSVYDAKLTLFRISQLWNLKADYGACTSASKKWTAEVCVVTTTDAISDMLGRKS